MKLSEQFHQTVQQYHTQLREITRETTYSTMNLDGAGLTATINKMACFPNTVTKDHGFQRVQPNKESVVAFCKAVDG